MDWITLRGLEEHFGTTLNRVEELSLKPHQKKELISRYIVPHFLYSVTLATPPVSTLRRLDGLIKQTMKKIYHLPTCITDGLIYCAKRDGGLAVPKMTTVAVSSSLKAGFKFLENGDPVIQAVAVESGLKKRLEQLEFTWPIQDIGDINKYKIREKKADLSRWAVLKTQGKAVKTLADDRIANAWLFKPTLMKPNRYITALRMRTNTAGDKMALNRIKPLVDLTCRKCKVQRETLGHILGQCISTKSQRIRRHDEIKDYVLEKIIEKDKDTVMMREPTITDPEGGNLKPDLVVKNQEGVFVVDITVRHEDGDCLQKGHDEKIKKYTPLLPALQEKLGMTTSEVLPLVIGTRGAMPKSTIRALEKLKITERNTLITISLMAHRSSIEIYNTFMDYDGRIMAPD
jgi:hypothetical protein